MTVILPADLKADIDRLKERLHLDQSSFIRHLLYVAIREEKIKRALEEYARGKVSFGKASELAGIGLWELVDDARRRNVMLRFTMRDAADEIAKITSGAYDRFLD
ncbi:MAG: UPF0175 family protein [Promethearchaeota archaeon]